jgi:hypothetical protein
MFGCCRSAPTPFIPPSLSYCGLTTSSWFVPAITPPRGGPPSGVLGGSRHPPGYQLPCCHWCGVPTSLRSRHCRRLGRCVHKYDHYCWWLSTVIGEKGKGGQSTSDLSCWCLLSVLSAATKGFRSSWDHTALETCSPGPGALVQGAWPLHRTAFHIYLGICSG